MLADLEECGFQATNPATAQIAQDQERCPRRSVSPIMRAGRRQGAIMDLGGWLRSLGLEQYEAAFRENEINERVLPSLTQED